MSNSRISREEREYLRYLRDVHFRNQGGKCYYCKVDMTPADVPDPKPSTTVTIEHLKGRASGGGSNYLNTAASCLGCNSRRAHQKQVGKKTVPIIRVHQKHHRTFAYTVLSDPDTLVLYNSSKTRDDVLFELHKLERQPITLKSTSEVS